MIEKIGYREVSAGLLVMALGTAGCTGAKQNSDVNKLKPMNLIVEADIELPEGITTRDGKYFVTYLDGKRVDTQATDTLKGSQMEHTYTYLCAGPDLIEEETTIYYETSPARESKKPFSYAEYDGWKDWDGCSDGVLTPEDFTDTTTIGEVS